jgi:hypothetical protein
MWDSESTDILALRKLESFHIERTSFLILRTDVT